MDSSNIYSQCITSGNGPCGTVKHGEKEICKIDMLNRSVEKHQNHKINIQQLRFIYLTERYLLENRLFIEINESSIICPCLCDNQGIYWRSLSRSSSALENKTRKPQLQTLPILLLNHCIKSNKSNKPVPIQSKMCQTHYRKISSSYI